MLPGDMGRTGRQWNVISEPYPGLRGYATAYSWNPLRKGLLTGIYVLPNSSRFFSMRFTPLNSRIFLHLNPKSHLLSNLKGRRLQIYLRPFSWLILRLQEHSKKPHEVRERIVQLMGDLPRIELFARQATPGWDVWGNEVDSSVSFS